MKTEEILRYEAEFKAMEKTFGTFLLVYEFPRQPPNLGETNPNIPEEIKKIRSCVGAKHS